MNTKKIIANVGKILEDHIQKSRKRKTHALNQLAPEIVAKELKLKKYLKNGFDSSSEIYDFVLKYLNNTNNLSHPHYMGHQVSVPNDLAGIPELIHGTINNPSSIYEMGPAGSTCEGFMINWMLDKIGWENNKDFYDFKFQPGKPSGVLTHGGSLANLTALSAARSNISPESWVDGNESNLVVIGPESVHYSILRSLSILGLGQKSFVPIPVDKNEMMILSELDKVYKEQTLKEKKVMCLVANACATSTGLFDPLDKLGNFCNKNNIWFHVDGAHGASALISKKYKKLVTGIEKADSIIWDAHKMMQVPSLCTAVLFKDFKFQAGAFQQKGTYVFHDDKVLGIDSMPYTIECTKSALGTKLFWAFAIKGEKSMENFITESFNLSKKLYNLLSRESDFETPYKPQCNILCFRYIKYSKDNDFQLKLRYKIINNNYFYISSCEINNTRYLRVVLINPLTKINHLKELLLEIKEIAKTLII